MSQTYQAAVDSRGIGHALWRYKWRAGGFFVVAMVVAASYALLAPRTYRSEGRLIVRMGAGRAARSPSSPIADSPSYSIPQSWESRVNTVVELLQSRPLVEQVVDAVGPSVINQSLANVDRPETITNDPLRRSLCGARERIAETVSGVKRYFEQLGSDSPQSRDQRGEAIAAIGKRLRVEPLRGSGVVAVSFTSSSPQVAHSVVSALIERYSDEHLRLNSPRGAEELFGSEKSKRLKELAAKQQQLRDLRNQAGPVSADGQRPLIVERIARLEHELSQTEAEISAGNAKLTKLRSELALAVKSVPRDDAPNADTPNFEDVQAELDDLRTQQREAAAKYTEDHPKMKQLRRAEADLKELLVAKPADATASSVQVAADVQAIGREIAAEEPQIASLEAKRQSLDAQLQAVRLKWQDLNQNDVVVAALLRDIEALEANYQQYVAGIEQTKIDRALAQERISDVAVLDAASFEPLPSSPQVSLCLVIGAICGFLGATALALGAQRRARAFTLPDEIDFESQVPVLASIPRLKRRQMILTGRN